MSVEIPQFHTLLGDNNQALLVEVAPHDLDPAVLFDMFGELTLRYHNIANKHFKNIYLQPVAELPESVRSVITEMPTEEADTAINGLFRQFKVKSELLKKVSESEYFTLADYCTDRIRHGLSSQTS